ENACKFSKDQQCKIVLAVSQNRLEVKFSDNGIGIAAEDIENIFKPFYRGSNQTYKEGNGIGLALTNKIVVLHKGKLLVESVVGQGTTFIIQFES
ncbi:sensor histidine kinase, partial [Myroides injenensis]|uniref:sensor histidine kinase n=1 Tax=Myroides injenensis TaxID=1183151 RepID=UPI00226EF885